MHWLLVVIYRRPLMKSMHLIIHYNLCILLHDAKIILAQVFKSLNVHKSLIKIFPIKNKKKKNCQRNYFLIYMNKLLPHGSHLSRRHRLLILQRQDLPSWLFEAEICCVFRNSDPSSSKLWHQATVLAGTTAETMAQSSKTLLPTPTLIVKLQSLRAHAISAQISVAASFYHVLCRATSVLILEV